MKRKPVLLGLLVAMVLTIVVSLAGVAEAATVPTGALGTVAGPTILANGRLQYEVSFPEGKDFGAAHVTVRNGEVSAQFFDSKEEYRAAFPELAVKLDASTSVTRMGTAAPWKVDLSGSLSAAGVLAIHQRRIEAWNYLGAEALYANCLSATHETYTYNGTSVTSASYWAAMSVYNDWQDWGPDWHTYSGPTCTIGGVPAANVLVTSLFGFVQDGSGDHVYLNTRTRGYGSGYGIASFTYSKDPGVLWCTWDTGYNIVNVY